MSSRPASESITTMTELILPTHANTHGNVFGGQVAAWIDLCAAICAQRHTRRTVITAGIDDLTFERPIKVGQVAQLTARVTATFRTSLEVRVQVDGEDALAPGSWPCVSAFVTFVAMDEGMTPTEVASLAILTTEDRILADAAQERRAARLARRRRAAE